MADWSGAEAYRRSFGLLCAGAVDPLLDAVGAPDGRLLDVGTGPGTVAIAAAARGWQVTAVEPDPAMRRIAQASGVAVQDGSLPALPFPDGAFGAAVANFVVNHLADPRRGVRGLARVVRPGGVVGVSIWPDRASALPALWQEVIRAADAEQHVGPRLDPALDFPRTAAGLTAIMAEAGLAHVALEQADIRFLVDPDALWAAVEAGIGSIGSTWRAAPEPVRAAMRDAFGPAVAPAVVDGRAQFPATALIARGVVVRSAAG